MVGKPSKARCKRFNRNNLLQLAILGQPCSLLLLLKGRCNKVQQSGMSHARPAQCECFWHERSNRKADVKDVSTKNESYFPKKVYIRCVQKEIVPWTIKFICTDCIEKIDVFLTSGQRVSNTVSFCISQQ